MKELERNLKLMISIVVAACLLACGNNRKERQETVLSNVRKQFFDAELQKAERQLARTDSLLRVALADSDTLNVDKRIYRDSLELELDVQGAKIRYIHKKRKN